MTPKSLPAMPTFIKLPLITLAVCLSLSACTDHASVEKATAMEAERDQQIELLGKVHQEMQRMESKFEVIQKENAQLTDKNAALQTEIEAKAKDIEKLKKDFENYKVQYKLGMQKRVPGLHVEDFTVDNMTYRQVTLKTMTDKELTFSHDAGVQKLKLEDLPPSLRDLLGLNIALPTEDTNPLSDSERAMLLKGDHELAVAKADTQRRGILEELEKARSALQVTRETMGYKLNNHQPVTGMAKTISDLETKISRLQGQAAQADMNAYQARQEKYKMLPIR